LGLHQKAQSLQASFLRKVHELNTLAFRVSGVIRYKDGNFKVFALIDIMVRE
jgi:hypothetical protein